MLKKIFLYINRFLNNFSFALVRQNSDFNLDKSFKEIYLKAKPFSMTSPERMFAMYQAVRYVVKNKIKGDVVECGVWRGGSAMVGSLALTKLNETNRNIYLYDTYTGMTKPTEKDTSASTKIPAILKWEESKTNKNNENNWCYAPLKDVKNNLYGTGYPKNKIVFVKGDVLKTIPKKIPNKIAILRLDTDWYESTYHELVYLFPKLVFGGVLIIDDYGHWNGVREAVDRYFAENNINMLVNRIDYSGVLSIKN